MLREQYLGFQSIILGPDYMVNFSPGWDFAPPTGLKYCCDYMVNFSPGAKRQFPWESLLRCENTIDTHARAPFSARTEEMIEITWLFLKILARFENTGLGFSARLTALKFQTGFWNKSSDNQVVDYMERDSARGALQPGLKILARYSQTRLGFSARPNGLKNPCNRYHFFSPGWKRSANTRIYCVFAPQ